MRLHTHAADENSVRLVGEFYNRGLHVLSSEDNDGDPDDLVLQSIFRGWYGMLLLRATSEEAKATKTLERTLKDIEAVNVAGFIRVVIDIAETELQMYYLCKALRAKSSGDSVGSNYFASHLSDLALRGNFPANSWQSHEFLRIPGVTGRLPKGKIRVNNQDIRIKDWLDELKRHWDL
jgi:hypothetical protein